MTIEEIKQAMKETISGLDKVLFNEMKTQLINSVLPEIVEKMNESILSEDSKGIKAKILDAIKTKREEDKTYDELLKENEELKNQIASKDFELKDISENKIISNVLSSLDVTPYDNDLIINLVKNSKEFIDASGSKKGVTDEMLKEKIMSIAENQAFLFKPQNPPVQWGVNPTDDIVKNNPKSNPYQNNNNIAVDTNGFDDINYMIKKMN